MSSERSIIPWPEEARMIEESISAQVPNKGLLAPPPVHPAEQNLTCSYRINCPFKTPLELIVVGPIPPSLDSMGQYIHALPTKRLLSLGDKEASPLRLLIINLLRMYFLNLGVLCLPLQYMLFS